MKICSQRSQRTMIGMIITLFAMMAMTLIVGCGGGNDDAAPPTQLTDFRVVARHDAVSFVPDEYGIARLPEGVEVYFWVGGAVYPLGTTGTRGGFGGVDGVAIKSAFWVIEGEGGKFEPVTIPFTKTPGEGYNLYTPANGEYIIVASFVYEGKAVTTAPLHFTVGAWTPPQ